MCLGHCHQTEVMVHGTWNISKKVFTVANLAKVLGALFARVKGLLVFAFNAKALGSGLGSGEVLVHLNVFDGGFLVGLVILIVAVKVIFTLKDLFESVLPISAVPHGESSKEEERRGREEEGKGREWRCEDRREKGRMKERKRENMQAMAMQPSKQGLSPLLSPSFALPHRTFRTAAGNGNCTP